jgi:hypothetical protein
MALMTEDLWQRDRRQRFHPSVGGRFYFSIRDIRVICLGAVSPSLRCGLDASFRLGKITPEKFPVKSGRIFSASIGLFRPAGDFTLFHRARRYMSACMHSTTLKSTDFQLTYKGREINHGTFFQDWMEHDRLGLLTPGGGEGAGAVSLVMAAVTAFYDRYRAKGLKPAEPDDSASMQTTSQAMTGETMSRQTPAEDKTFYTYPDYFTFQRHDPPANYGMLDIWPGHKNVVVSNSPNETAAAITDRGINLLLLPDAPAGDPHIEPLQAAALRRNIRRCFLYSVNGNLEDPTLSVRAPANPLSSWTLKMLNTLPETDRQQSLVAQWRAIEKESTFEQSFQEITVEEAIKRL